MLNLFLDLRNINQNDEQTQIFICFIRVQLMALDIGIWAEVFFGSIRYARFVSIPVWKSIRFSGTSLARYPHVDTLLAIHGLHTTYLLARTGPLYILHASQQVVYKHYAHMYLCTVQCTTYYILSTARLLVLQRARQQSLQSLVSKVSLFSTVYSTVPYTLQYVLYRGSNIVPTQRGPRYDIRYAYRSEGPASVRYVPYRKSEKRIDDTATSRHQPFIDHIAVFSLLTSVARSVEWP